MGVYLVSVGARQWYGTDEGDLGAVASGLDEELRRRGLPPCGPVPPEPDPGGGPGTGFEEKSAVSMDGFAALCRTHLTPREEETLCGWSVLVPLALDEEVRLPVGSNYADETVIAGAPQVLALAERLATAIGLPQEALTVRERLGLTNWFLNGAAARRAEALPGPWGEDLDAAFHVAFFVCAARHALRRGCPLVYV
ncbi:hypothetical protein ACFWBI_10105 [Streptomyces sp. NPDC059982]|uniref:hypothetical protein n=1 Tax=unclassified Streptomyces TaxID=2593676 RepID=UPI0036937DA6